MGGATTALAVYVLAFKRGSTSGYRLILVGIAISYLLISITDYLLARAGSKKPRRRRAGCWAR